MLCRRSHGVHWRIKAVYWRSPLSIWHFWSLVRFEYQLEKSTVYLAGVEESEKRSILTNYPFEEGKLPVRYLGLPLMTQSMRRQYFLPLLEKIISKICTWTCRFLSYAGRLQLINSVLISIANFWLSVFRLPSKCVKEVEQMCSAFLWTGPALKSSGAKVSWKEICSLKSEGGIGIRNLKEVNTVYGLKLIYMEVFIVWLALGEMVKSQSAEGMDFLGSKFENASGFLDVA